MSNSTEILRAMEGVGVQRHHSPLRAHSAATGPHGLTRHLGQGFLHRVVDPTREGVGVFALIGRHRR